MNKQIVYFKIICLLFCLSKGKKLAGNFARLKQQALNYKYIIASLCFEWAQIFTPITNNQICECVDMCSLLENYPKIAQSNVFLNYIDLIIDNVQRTNLTLATSTKQLNQIYELFHYLVIYCHSSNNKQICKQMMSTLFESVKSTDKIELKGQYQSFQYYGQNQENLPNGFGVMFAKDKSVILCGLFEKGQLLFGKNKHSDGNVYEGYYQAGKLNKYGGISTKQIILLGFFNNDQLISGKIIFKSGRTLSGKFITQNGIGVATTETNNIMEGEFENGVLNGKGRIQKFSGDVFEGEFVNGQLCGKGIRIEGYYYFSFGYFKDNKLNGNAKILSSNSLSYGTFKNDYFCGKGTQVMMNTNDIIEIQYKYKEYKGDGSRVFPSVMSWEGAFESSCLMSGKISFADGRKLEGNFDIKDGFGVRTSWNGDVYEGEYQSKQLINGKKTTRYGAILEGSFQQGLLVDGKIINPKTMTLEGRFDNGVFFEGNINFNDGRQIQCSLIPARIKGNVCKIRIQDHIGIKVDFQNAIYEGLFDDQNMLLQGVITSHSKIQSGDFRNEKLCGQGQISIPDVMTWEGKFKDNELQNGKIIFNDGRTLEGDFTIINGVGVRTRNSDDIDEVLEGTFVNGKLCGWGKITNQFGIVAEGDFFENNMCGRYKIAFPNGLVYEEKGEQDNFALSLLLKNTTGAKINIE